MTPATADLSQVDRSIRAEALHQLTTSGVSEQFFLNQVYRRLVEGQFSLLDLLGPNAETLAAIQELEEGSGTSHDSIDALFADLHADD
jgi:DNA-damage-inducible protein J